MKNFIVYNSEGKILRTGFCPDEIVGLQAKDGEFTMEGTANDIEDRIHNGRIERKTKDELDRIKTETTNREKKAEEERTIRDRMDKILRDQAVAELKKEGKL